FETIRLLKTHHHQVQGVQYLISFQIFKKSYLDLMIMLERHIPDLDL
ncbi:8089_t:CDS:1, partial [Racocetra fulgida]